MTEPFLGRELSVCSLKQPVLGTCGMVATAHYLATYTGLHILTHGGNAIDAAIVAAAAMTVVYPSTCSAGGDVFMLTQITVINPDTHIFEGAADRAVIA